MRAPPLHVIIAAVLLALLSLANALPLFFPRGIPDSIVYLSVVLSVLGLVATTGLCMRWRWGEWLTIIVCVLNILLATPGLVFAPNTKLQDLAVFGVVGFVVVMLLAVPRLHVIIAAVLLALLSLANALPLFFPRGIPDSIVYLSVVLSVLGLVATTGLCMRWRWGEWLTIIVCVLSILLVVLVVLEFAPNTKLQGFALDGVVGFVVVMLLAVSLRLRQAET